MKTKTKTIIGTILGLTFISYLIMSKKYLTPTKSGKRRECDPKGCGHFGASRGTRKHMGIDFVSVVGEPIYAPFSGKITRHPYATSDLVHKGIEIVSGPEKHQLFYLKPIVAIGTTVKKGDIIGYADDIQKKYGTSMTNHVHHEITVNGKFIDPSKLYA